VYKGTAGIRPFLQKEGSTRKRPALSSAKAHCEEVSQPIQQIADIPAYSPYSRRYRQVLYFKITSKTAISVRGCGFYIFMV
jgi:hypothetical protein